MAAVAAAPRFDRGIVSTDPTGAIASEDRVWLRSSDGECSYEKPQICSMAWSLDHQLHHHLYAAVPNGGPIAILKAERIAVHSATGFTISEWKWESSRALRLGWTHAHELVAVLESGRILLWSMQGERLADFGLGLACEANGLRDCALSPNGAVVLTQTLRLFALLSFEERTLVSAARLVRTLCHSCTRPADGHACAALPRCHSPIHC
eukprot:6214014-Pleurochrysis_carterae.AAC.1